MINNKEGRMASFLLTGAVSLLLAACGGDPEPADTAAPVEPAAQSPVEDTTVTFVESDDALVPGTDFHAVGQVSCANDAGQPTGQCDFGVTREGGGTAMVTITLADGTFRAIFFEDGEPVGADTSEAGGGGFFAEKNDDLFIVHIGEERYEIPDIVVFGD